VRKAASLLFTVAFLCAGCSDNQGSGSTPAGPAGPSASGQDQLVVNVEIQGGNVTPTNAQLQATVNEPIIIRVDSDTTDELHVHSNPEHSYKIDAKPGQSFRFTVAVPGKVDVELHELNKTVATISVQ
jgi:hypothetical protein